MSSMSRVIIKRLSCLKNHPNADNLLIGESDGMPFIINKNDSKEGDLRCITPFDIQCPDEEWCGWVRNQRIRPVRLRGVFSMAVCIPLPPGEFTEGEDVTERLGFTKWEPREVEERDGVALQHTKSGPTVKGPSINVPYYDLESLRKYHNNFIEGERVIIQEKIEGENICVVYYDGKLHIRSRNLWKEEGNNKWWHSVRKYDWVWLQDYPGLVVFGEKYGNVNKFRYDCKDGEELIRIFDLYDTTKGKFLSWKEVVSKMVFVKNSPYFAPVLYDGPWLGLDFHKHLGEGKSSFGENLREGFTVRPFEERKYGKHFNRLYLKYHGIDYLVAKGKMK